MEPSDWAAFKRYLNELGSKRPLDPPGRKVMDETLPLEAPADALTEARIDLSKALDGDTGHLVVIVEPPAELFDRNRGPYYNTVRVWVQVTQIGLDALADHSQMVAWATDLKDGAPLGGVTIEADPGNPVATTGPDGTARFDLPIQKISLLVARQGDDTAILPKSTWMWGEDRLADPAGAATSCAGTSLTTAPCTGQARRYTSRAGCAAWAATQTGDVGLAGDAVSSVSYSVMDPQGNELTTGSSPVNALGGFDLAFTLPENDQPGLRLHLVQRPGQPGWPVEQPPGSIPSRSKSSAGPSSRCTARNETTGPYLVGEHAVVAVEASYYAGGPLPNAEVTWQVSSSPSSYSPPNWPDFTFGTWMPWWYYWEPVYYGESY